jgi:predicted nucleic acid-binding protein
VAVIRLCLDTSAYSRLMRGQQTLQDRLEAADEILLPVTMLGEVYAGFQGGNRLEENLSLLSAFRSQPGVVIIDTTDNCERRLKSAARGGRKVQRRGWVESTPG